MDESDFVRQFQESVREVIEPMSEQIWTRLGEYSLISCLRMDEDGVLKPALIIRKVNNG